MGKMTKVILVFLGLFMLVGLMGLGPNSGADIAETESSDNDRNLHSSLEDDVEEVVRIPPPPVPTSAEEIDYQGDIWEMNATMWANNITADSEALVFSLDSMDASRIKNDAYRIQVLCELALEDNQKYDVSPSLRNNKDEYETGLEDYVLAMEHIQLGMDSLNNNDKDAFTLHMELADSYILSAEIHMYASSLTTFARSS